MVLFQLKIENVNTFQGKLAIVRLKKNFFLNKYLDLKRIILYVQLAELIYF